jgi:hypothetical protein
MHSALKNNELHSQTEVIYNVVKFTENEANGDTFTMPVQQAQDQQKEREFPYVLLRKSDRREKRKHCCKRR